MIKYRNNMMNAQRLETKRYIYYFKAGDAEFIINESISDDIAITNLI